MSSASSLDFLVSKKCNAYTGFLDPFRHIVFSGIKTEEDLRRLCGLLERPRSSSGQRGQSGRPALVKIQRAIFNFPPSGISLDSQDMILIWECYKQKIQIKIYILDKDSSDLLIILIYKVQRLYVLTVKTTSM